MKFRKNIYFIQIILVYIASIPPLFAVPTIEEYAPSYAEKELNQATRTIDEYNEVMAADLERRLSYSEGIVQLKDSFHLRQVVVKNNPTISDQALASAYEQFIGHEVQFDDLLAIARNITALYHQQGYFLSYALIPTQDVSDGKLEVLVLEGIVDDVYIVDKTPEEHSKLMMQFAKEVLNEIPLTRDTYSTFLTRANDLPGIRIIANLVPSQDTTGASTLVLKVIEDKFKVSFGTLNHISDRYGDHAEHASITYNNIANSYQTNLQIFRSDIFHSNRLATVSAQHKQYIGKKGAFWQGELSSALSKPDFKDAAINQRHFFGRGKAGSLFATYPFINNYKYYFSVRMGLNIKNNYTSVDEKVSTYDKTRAFRLGIQYQNKFFELFKQPSQLKTHLTLEKHFKVLGASKGHADDRPRSIRNSAADGSRLTANALWVQPIGIQGMYFNAEVDGQKAFNKMPGSATYSYGGMRYGRGFNSSELSGDSGVSAQFEINYVTSNLPHHIIQYFKGYLLYDVGTIWKNGYISANVHRRQTASSTAMGFRAGLLSDLHLDVYLAKPLSSPSHRKAMKVFGSLTLLK